MGYLSLLDAIFFSLSHFNTAHSLVLVLRSVFTICLFKLSGHVQYILIMFYLNVI